MQIGHNCLDKFCIQGRLHQKLRYSNTGVFRVPMHYSINKDFNKLHMSINYSFTLIEKYANEILIYFMTNILPYFSMLIKMDTYFYEW